MNASLYCDTEFHGWRNGIRFGLFPGSRRCTKTLSFLEFQAFSAETRMGRLLQPLLLYLTVATDRELARQVQFLKEENRILRDKLPRRISVTPKERRRLIKFGRGLGPVLNELISIVTPRTFARWLSGERRSRRSKRADAKTGRPRTPDEIRDLIVRLATETGWGYTRILGELKKLGITVARSTVVATLKAQGFDSGPKREEGTWFEFVQRHSESLWACDFFSKKVWTTRGLVDVFVLFFIHIGTRRVHVSGLTANPDETWIIQQARNVSMMFAEQPKVPKYLIMDLDEKLTARFRATLEQDGLLVIRVGPRKPNLNAFAERFVQTIKQECLDHFVCFGIDHLRHIVMKYQTYYNRHRPHQGRNNRTLPSAEGMEGEPIPVGNGPVNCQPELGGLLRHYYRRAA